MLWLLAQNLGLQTLLFWTLTAILTALGIPFVLSTSVGVWLFILGLMTVAWLVGWAIGHWLGKRV